MKKIILLLATLSPLAASAQNTEGKIIYEQEIKIDLESRLEGVPPERAEMIKKRLQSMSKGKKVLLFNKAESFYRDFDAASDGDDEWNSIDGSTRATSMRTERKIYMNMDSEKMVEQREIYGKAFLIKDDIEKIKWKMTGEQEKILNYTCQQAKYQEDSVTVIAWFTTEIPVSAGPNIYGQLPGIILKLDVDNGQQVFTASKVEFKKLEKNAISEPTKGKEVTKEEFKKIVKEKRKEMREMYGGQGGRHH